MSLRRKDYKVRLTGRAGIEYQEGPRRMMIDSELLSGPTYDVVIYIDSMRRWAVPYDGDVLTPDDIVRFRSSIGEALKHLEIDGQ
jgi:hypothetical protein